MNILVIGAGRFGKALANFFVEAGHTVVIVDKNEEKIKGIEDKVSQAVILDSTNEEALKQLSLEDFDYVFLCISDVSASILTAQILLESKVKKIYAKASSDVHAKILSRLGVSKIVQPERQSAENLAMSVIMGAEDLLTLLKRKNVVVAGVQVPEEFEGKTLSELNIRKRFGVFVVAVERKEPDLKVDAKSLEKTSLGLDSKVKIEILPEGDFIVSRADKLIVVGEANRVEEFRNYVEEKRE